MIFFIAASFPQSQSLGYDDTEIQFQSRVRAVVLSLGAGGSGGGLDKEGGVWIFTPVLINSLFQMSIPLENLWNQYKDADSTTHGSEHLWKEQLCFQRQSTTGLGSIDFECFSIDFCPLDFFF